jgi:hypothetical protein
LTVPLYKAVFDKYKGGVIPPAAAFERDLVAFGVSEKQKDRARQVFERAADQAGFFEHGKNRLVMPGVASRGSDTPADESKDKGKGGGGNGAGSGGGGGDDLPPGTDPIIAGLLKRLPKAGDVWPRAQRKLWLQLLEGSFDLIYQADDEAAH